MKFVSCAAARNILVSGALICLSGTASLATETGKSFEEIMGSIASVGSISNGDGHRWKFRNKSDGSWEVEGVRRETARVTSAGPDAISIDGFPDNWGANGRFLFSEKEGKCRLKSDHSGHRLKWKC